MELPISKPAFFVALESCSQGVLFCGCSKEGQLRKVSFGTQQHRSILTVQVPIAVPLPPPRHLLALQRSGADPEIRSYR